MNSFLGAHCPVKLRIASIKKRQNCADAILDYLLQLRRLARVTPGSQEPVTEVKTPCPEGRCVSIGWGT